MIWKLVVFVPLYMVWVLVALALSMSVFPPEKLALPMIVTYIILIMAPIWLFYKWYNAAPSWEASVKATGKTATATVTKVRSLGITINNSISIVRVSFHVEPHDEAPFDVSQNKQVSFLGGLGSFYEGSTMAVKYDPDNHSHLVILDTSESSDSANSPSHNSSSYFTQYNLPEADVAQELAQLANLHEKGALTDEEFHAAKKKLLS
ncbi:MAG TPA: SHOCT domain-containing protein [Anaerolineae bacterium]|jgi:hypothetical protein